MRFKKSKNAADIAALEKHFERLKDKYEGNFEIRNELTENNYHLIYPESSYRQKIMERIDESNAKRRKNSVLMLSFVIGASYEYMLSLSFVRQKEYFDLALDYFKERFGEENFISAVVHMDENAPHMHFAFVPVTKDNRLAASSLIGKKQDISLMYRDFYLHMEKKFPDLEMPDIRYMGKLPRIPNATYKRSYDLIEKAKKVILLSQRLNIFNIAKKRDGIIETEKEIVKYAIKLKEQIESNSEYLKDVSQRCAILETELIREREISEKLLHELKEERDKEENYTFEIKRLQSLISSIPREIRNRHFKGEEQFKGVIKWMERG